MSRASAAMAWLLALVLATGLALAATPRSASGQETASARIEGEAFVETTPDRGQAGGIGDWTFTPQCGAGACDLEVGSRICAAPCPSGNSDSQRATDVLTFDGSAYAGVVRVGVGCVDEAGRLPNSVDAPSVNRAADVVWNVTLQVAEAQMSGGELMATRVVGRYEPEVTGPVYQDFGVCTVYTRSPGDLQFSFFGLPVDPEVTEPVSPPATVEVPRPPASPGDGSPEPAAGAPVEGAGGVVAAAHRRGQAVISASLTTPGDVSTVPVDLATSGLLAAVIALLVVFPSELFNRTFEEHHDEIVGWFRRRRVPESGAAPPIPGALAADVRGVRRGWAAFAVVTVVSGGLYGLLDPAFGLNRSSLVAFVGVVTAIVVLTLAGGLAAGAYIRRRVGDASYRLRVFPSALVVAGACVLVSRLADFQPGYLYGLIGGFAFVRELEGDDEAKKTLATSLWLLVLSLLVWAVWTPLNAAVEDGAGLGLGLLDAALAAVFIAGVEGLLFGLLPLKFLSGEKLLRWSKPLWFAAYTLVVFAFLAIVVRPDGGPVTESSTLTVLILFGAFATISITFWSYFRYRPAPATT